MDTIRSTVLLIAALGLMTLVGMSLGTNLSDRCDARTTISP